MTGKGTASTLEGIANRLGLHISTVSRVLNGTPDQASAAASSATREAIREAARELGYRSNPAVLAGSPYATTAQDRARGFLEVFAEAGIVPPAGQVLFMGFDAIAGRIATEHLLETVQPVPDAIFFANDFGAIATLGVLRDKGLAVPAVVAVVGFNDVELAAEVNPALTTIRSPMWEMGSAGMRSLAALIEGQPVESRRLAPTLVVRQSTAATSAEHRFAGGRAVE
jgi:DNA-binding LacI/PurR family transcriptional regulator